MTKIWAAVMFLLASSASALAPSPIGVLRGAKLVNLAQFEYAHATYSVWNLGGRVPMKGVFGSDATTIAQANQFRMFQLSTAFIKSLVNGFLND